MSVHYIELRTSIHATESDDRVKTALSMFLFDNPVHENRTEGHFGNPIMLLEGHIKGIGCDRFIALLKQNLPTDEFEKLKNECCERVDDDCCLHIRFDKQAAFEGKFKLATSGDAITARMKMRAYPARKEKALEVAEKMLGIIQMQ